MRKRVFALVLVVIVLSGVTVIIFRLTSTSRRKTLVGWKAHVSTVAGDGSPAHRVDSQQSQASLDDPFGIAVSPEGVLYFSEAGESNRIRKINTDGVVSTLAGGVEGYSDGTGTQASFNTPSGLALDSRGNIYVADTGNNRIRKITPEGSVSTVAGDGTAGYADGPAGRARFDGPIGIAVDAHDNIFVADTYNDRVRLISTVGEVTTVAGGDRPGAADGDGASALFDTPCALVVMADGNLIVADTGNDRLRKISPDRRVTTLQIVLANDGNTGETSITNVRSPVGLALTQDGFVYVTELDRSRIVQIAADGTTRVLAGAGPGFADGQDGAHFNHPTGIALDHVGDLYVADSGNYLVRKLSQTPGNGAKAATLPEGADLPHLTSATLNIQSLPWPLAPQQQAHEVVATVGEVRGSFNSTDNRDHLHSGLDVFAAYGDVVRAVRSEKVSGPLSNWGFADLNEGMRVGVISYIHIQVGRDKDGQWFDDARFIPIKDDDGKLARIRVRRGTRFQIGDAVGTVNRMYHVHLNVGPPGGEINPLSLSPVGFSDHVAPTIEKDGIQLFDQTGTRIVEKHNGRLIVRRPVRIVVDAFDRTDMNGPRRRLGLFSLGYQVLKSDGTAVPGFEQPRINIVFNLLPPDRNAAKLAYADQSGITVYGSSTTRFLYEITNVVRDGQAAFGVWDPAQLARGDYILRIIAADFSGNQAQEGRDVPVTVESH